MTWKYRCNKCRGRNVFLKLLEDYVRPRRCRHCGHGCFYLDRRRQYRTDYCSCTEGYHHMHRLGSPLCIHHPQFELNSRVARGEELKDVLLEIALRDPTPVTGDCPF